MARLAGRNIKARLRKVELAAQATRQKVYLFDDGAPETRARIQRAKDDGFDVTVIQWKSVEEDESGEFGRPALTSSADQLQD
jgi:hypothetical protein